MYRLQFSAISRLDRPSSQNRRGVAHTSVNQPQPRMMPSPPTSSTALQTMRWAMIRNDGTSLSRCQYSGNRPQMTKAKVVAHRPLRVSLLLFMRDAALQG